jgi:hypothetical protein
MSTLAKNPLIRSSYEGVLGAGFIPRRAFAHFFINDSGLKSQIHLQNYYSFFFPDSLTAATATVWLHDHSGKQIAKKSFEVAPFGQLYLGIEDILGKDIPMEGMVYVDLKPPRIIRKQMKTLPNLLGVEANTPFWVSFRDENENYMYVHSIESYRGKVFGAMWPLNKVMEKAPPQRDEWSSWRLLDVNLLDEFQIVVMNHSRVQGNTTLKVFDQGNNVVWSKEIKLEPRESNRVRIPSEEISRWKELRDVSEVRIGLTALMTSNGKPYVMMRYGGGPLSLHHG